MDMGCKEYRVDLFILYRKNDDRIKNHRTLHGENDFTLCITHALSLWTMLTGINYNIYNVMNCSQLCKSCRIVTVSVKSVQAVHSNDINNNSYDNDGSQ